MLGRQSKGSKDLTPHNPKHWKLHIWCIQLCYVKTLNSKSVLFLISNHNFRKRLKMMNKRIFSPIRWVYVYFVLCLIIFVGIKSASTKGRQNKQNQRRNHGNTNRYHGDSDERDGERTVNTMPLLSDRKSWCEPRSIQQVIDHPGCTAKTIHNLVSFNLHL